MKRIWIIRLGICFAFLLCLWAVLSLGARAGVEIGKTHYHNDYMRYLQAELGELKSHLDQDEIGKVKIKIERISDLARSAGNEKKFHKILSSRDASKHTPE